MLLFINPAAYLLGFSLGEQGMLSLWVPAEGELQIHKSLHVDYYNNNEFLHAHVATMHCGSIQNEVERWHLMSC